MRDARFHLHLLLFIFPVLCVFWLGGGCVSVCVCLMSGARAGLIIYHFDAQLGETWDRWSYLQLAAFVVLVAGTFVYVYAREETPDAAAAAAPEHDDEAALPK